MYASPSASVSLPSLCLTEVASLLCLSFHLVLSVFLSLALTICLRYYLNAQSLSLWVPLSFPGGICGDLRSLLRACVVIVLLCRGVAIIFISSGHFLGSLSCSCLCHLFSGCPSCPKSFSLSVFLPYSHSGIFLPPSLYVSLSQLEILSFFLRMLFSVCLPLPHRYLTM